MNRCKAVPAAVFKQKCLALMSEVAAEGVKIIITRHGVPLCEVTPLTETPGPAQRFGWLKKDIQIHGDLTAPTGEEWEAHHP